MFGLMRLRAFTRQLDAEMLPRNRTVLAGVFTRWRLRAAILPLSAFAMLSGQAFAWPDPEKPKPANGSRLQLYPNRTTGLSKPEVDFQNSHAEKVAKSRRNARAQLDALRVELAWLADPSLFPHPPGIKAITSEDKPCVEIRGVVSSHALRQRALELAQRYCESPIRDKLMVLVGTGIPRQSIPTADLQAKAERYLTDRLIEFSQDLRIEEVYPSGSIRIGGRVLSYEDKVAVSRSLRRLTGCMAVDNRIEVSPMSQDGELVTVITSDGETSLPGKIDEKRNGPVALTRTDSRSGIGGIAGEEGRLESALAAKLTAPSSGARMEKRGEAPYSATPERVPAERSSVKTERPTERLVPIAAPVEKPSFPADDRNPLTRPLEFPSASAKPNPPVAKPGHPALDSSVGANPNTSAAATTGIAVIEEEPARSGAAQGVQAVADWAGNPPATQFNPDGTPIAPPQGNNPQGLFPNRPRMFFQPSTTPPASQRPSPPPGQRTAVRFLPSANGTAPPAENPDAAQGVPGAPVTQVAPTGRRRTGFLNGLGQPTLPKPQPYLSPIDVVQSGRPGLPVQRSQPYANQPGAGPAAQPMTYGGVNRTLGGQPYQMPGAVRLTPRSDGQPGAGPASESAAQGLYPWDQPVLTDRTPRPSVETAARAVNEASARAATRPEWPNQPNPALGSNGATSVPERGFAASPAQLGRPIASTNDAFPDNRAMVSPRAGSQGQPAGPVLGSVTTENEPSPLPPGLTGSPSNRFPAPGNRSRSEPALAVGSGPSLTPPVGALPPPSTGTAVIEDEGPAIPAYVPARRNAGIPLEDRKTLEKNNRLLQGAPPSPPSIATTLPRPNPGPAPAEQGDAPPSVGTGTISMGTMVIDKDAINRPLPSAQALSDLAKKTCGSLISDIKTRNDGKVLCVEIVVKDALSEEEVLKRLCNLAAFSHPAIWIEVSRAQ